jgi:hypothetical protein
LTLLELVFANLLLIFLYSRYGLAGKILKGKGKSWAPAFFGDTLNYGLRVFLATQTALTLRIGTERSKKIYLSKIWPIRFTEIKLGLMALPEKKAAKALLS